MHALKRGLTIRPQRSLRLGLRALHTADVIPAKPSLQAPPPDSAVASAWGVPETQLSKLAPPQVLLRARLDLAAEQHARLLATTERCAGQLSKLEARVAAAFAGDDARAREPVPDAGVRLRQTAWPDLTSLFTFYEEVLYPIRAAHRTAAAERLTGYYLQDVVKRGLGAFTPEYLAEQRQELTAVQARVAAAVAHGRRLALAVFDTALINDLANLLRLAAERHEAARPMCLKVLTDATMMQIPFDAVTEVILRAVLFNDGPYEDSSLLFELIEAPERGEVSLSAAPLPELAQEMLRLISARHQTPLGEGVLLHSTETHPNLQRSAE